MGIYDADADPPYALFGDEKGIKAIAVLTEYGDGRYVVEIKSELSGSFEISLVFVEV